MFTHRRQEGLRQTGLKMETKTSDQRPCFTALNTGMDHPSKQVKKKKKKEIKKN